MLSSKAGSIGGQSQVKIVEHPSGTSITPITGLPDGDQTPMNQITPAADQ